MTACELFAEALMDARSAADLAPSMATHSAGCAGCRAQADAHFGMFAKMAAVQPAPSPAAWEAIAKRVATPPAPGFLESVSAFMRQLTAPRLVVAGACALLLFAFATRDSGMTYRASGSVKDGQGLGLPVTGLIAASPVRLTVAADAWIEVMMDPNSRVRVSGPASVAFGAKNRVELVTGTGTFDLGPHPNGFFVAVPTGQVRVVGTRFEVKAAADRAQVSVDQGVVELIPRSGLTARLNPGDAATLTGTAVERPATSPVPSPAPSATPSVDGPRIIEATASSSPTSAPSIKPVRSGHRANGGF